MQTWISRTSTGHGLGEREEERVEVSSWLIQTDRGCSTEDGREEGKIVIYRYEREEYVIKIILVLGQIPSWQVFHTVEIYDVNPRLPS